MHEGESLSHVRWDCKRHVVYAPTQTSISAGCVDESDPTINSVFMTCTEPSTDHISNLRDPSRHFMVFEIGDNSTVDEGEAEPLNLFYSRAKNFGDDYMVWSETDTSSVGL